GDAQADLVHHVQHLSICVVSETGGMPVGHDHQVAVAVGIGIEHDKGVRPAVDQKAFRVLLLALRRIVAEDAALCLVRRFDIFEPPGRPELFGHNLPFRAIDRGYSTPKFWPGSSANGWNCPSRPPPIRDKYPIADSLDANALPLQAGDRDALDELLLREE